MCRVEELNQYIQQLFDYWEGKNDDFEPIPIPKEVDDEMEKDSILLKPKRGSSRPVSVRMATDTLTMASRKTSCSDTVGNMAAVAPTKKCMDGQQVFDDF